MKTLAVIQVRTGSKRLPGKVLLPLKGKPMLERMLQRVLAANTISEVVVATTWSPEDELIRDICKRIGIQCFSGHPTDLLDRNYKAAINSNADIVVKIPGNSPLIDPTIIDKVLSYYFKNLSTLDFVSNLHPPTFPEGNDVEAMPIDILGIAWTEAAQDFDREHTTPYIWTQPDRFRLGNYQQEAGFDYSMQYKWTMDYMEDYIFMRTVYEELFSEGRMFLMKDILKLLEEEAELKNINRKYIGVNYNRYRSNKNEVLSVQDLAINK